MCMNFVIGKPHLTKLHYPVATFRQSQRDWAYRADQTVAQKGYKVAPISETAYTSLEN